MPVRRADEEDAESLSLLNADVQSVHAAAMPTRFKKAGSNTFPPTEARKLLVNPNNLIFIAEVVSLPVGYAYAEVVHHPESPFRYAWDEVHLHHISVRPAHRRKGVATALLNPVRGAWTFNEDAQAFFRRHGFVSCIVRFWNERAK
jgi:GNAT superfamily N-acetyltransferase